MPDHIGVLEPGQVVLVTLVGRVGDDEHLGQDGQTERRQEQDKERSKRSGEQGRHGAPPWNRKP
jgi:hypothetical protein